MRLLLLILSLSLVIPAVAQKSVYIPLYLQNPNTPDGSQFSWDKTAQSDNFILIWGNTVGTDPANYSDPDLAFHPQAILDTMEFIYTRFKALGFLDDTTGTHLSQFKIPIVMYNTWGPDGAQGYANGGDADGVIGAFWVHPIAMHDGGVAAHEFTHSLQAECVIDFRNNHGLGSVWNNSGIFWETHANFMRNLLYPQDVTAWGMDLYHLETWGDWKNTYENYEILLAIMESDGIDIINRIWRESLSNEYPLQAYKRLKNYSQEQFNDKMFEYVRRMPTFDFQYKNIGQFFRQYRSNDLMYNLPTVQNCYSILTQVAGSQHHYEMPESQAPEEFAYNVIPLYPEQDSCTVIVKFKGHTEANAHAGWRYGFVAAKPDGTVSRYSPTYSDDNREIYFSLQNGESNMYLVVMGAPFDQITTNVSNDTWHGYPKHFRFPYELNISGAVPEGFQTPGQFRAQIKSNGHLHANGGGWVQNSASVASTVYVAPGAIVLGNAHLSGQVRVENTAIVRDATISGAVKILDNSLVTGGTLSMNAVVKNQGFAENVTMSDNAVIDMRARVSNYHLSGNIEVGGDVLVYNQNGACDNGVYYRLTNYYDDKLLECDGRTATHPDNLNVNNPYNQFSDNDLAIECHCAATLTVDSVHITAPGCANPTGGEARFYLSNYCGEVAYAWSGGNGAGTMVSGLSAGAYAVTLSDAVGKETVYQIAVPAPSGLTADVTVSPYQCHGGAGGTVLVSPTSGLAPYAYHWDNGATSGTIGQLLPGVYAVTVTDISGCSVTKSAVVTVSGQLWTNATNSGIACHGNNDGTLEIFPIEGTPPYQWIWSNQSTDSVLTQIGGGTYAATITDALGCTGSETVYLDEPDALQLNLPDVPGICAGDSAVVVCKPAGGFWPYEITWSNGASGPSAEIYPAVRYFLTLTDAHGCHLVDSLVAALLPAPTITTSVSPASSMLAADGSIMLTSIGSLTPYSFFWNTGDITESLLNIAAGDYSVTVVNASGCYAVYQVNVPFLTATTSLAAPDWQAVIAPNPSRGAAVLMLDAPEDGRFSISVTDANGGNIWEKNMPVVTGRTLIKLPAEIPTGAYVVRILDKQGGHKELIWILVD